MHQNLENLENLFRWVDSVQVDKLYELLDAAKEDDKGKVEILIQYKLDLI
jgi:hypothetical protein